jgi:photosystem II stability/assembly factor-like uncharacterized protein
MRAAHSFLGILLASVWCGLGPCQEPPAWSVAGPLPVTAAAGKISPAERLAAAGGDRLWLTSGLDRSWLTADGGRTWKLAEAAPAFADSVFFFDEAHGWAAGETAYPDSKAFLVSTADGGKSWSTSRAIHESAEMSGCRGSEFSDVQFFDNRFGTAVGTASCGEATSQMLLASTHDGGANWKVELVNTDDPEAVLRRVRFQSRSVVWATGGSSVYMSRDSGATWSLAHRHLGAKVFGLAVVPGAGVFATGGFGLILRSRDFGETWTEAKLAPSVADKFFIGVAFADAKRGFACGTDGTIVSTTDGGDTWQPEPSGRNEFLRDIGVLDGQVYIAGDGPIVIKRPLEPVPSGPAKQGPQK